MMKNRKNLPFQWTDTKNIVSAITEANEKFYFGFSSEELKKQLESIVCLTQTDDLHPISVRILPKAETFEKSFEKLMQWLAYSLYSQGLQMGNFFFFKGTALSEKSRKIETDTIEITVISLKNSQAYFYDEGTWKSYPSGIELITLMAINPQMVRFIDGKILKQLRLPGLMILGNKELTPEIGYGKNGLYIKF